MTTVYGHGVRGSFGSTLGILGLGGFTFLVAWIDTAATTALLVAAAFTGFAFAGRSIRSHVRSLRVAVARRTPRPRTWEASMRDIADQMANAFVPGARGEVFATPGIIICGSTATIASIVDHQGPELLTRVLRSYWTTAIARRGAVCLLGVTPWVTWQTDDTMPANVFRLLPDRTPPTSLPARIAA